MTDRVSSDLTDIGYIGINCLSKGQRVNGGGGEFVARLVPFKNTITCFVIFVRLSSVRPSVPVRQLGTDWVDFRTKFDIIRVFLQKSVKNIQLSIKSEETNCYCTRRGTYIYDISLQSSYSDKYFRHEL